MSAGVPTRRTRVSALRTAREPFVGRMLCVEISFDFRTICVVVCQGGIHLRQRQMIDLVPDLLGREPELVIPGDAHDGHARACDPRAAAADLGRARDHGTDFDVRAHADSILPALTRPKRSTNVSSGSCSARIDASGHGSTNSLPYTPARLL